MADRMTAARMGNWECFAIFHPRYLALSAQVGRMDPDIPGLVLSLGPFTLGLHHAGALGFTTPHNAR